MNRSRRAWFWIAGGVVLCGAASVSLCFAQSIFESWRARSFLRITAAMRPGITTEVDALHALRSFGPGTRSTMAGEPLLSRVWDERSRSFLEANGRGYSFDNSGLHLLHLAGKKTIYGTLFFRQGRLVSTWVLQHESGGNAECFVRVLDSARDFTDLPDPGNGEGVTVDARGSPATSVLVNVYPGAAQSERSKAYALNPGSLASSFFCHDARSLIPKLLK